MVLSSRFEEALVYANQLHAGQLRKATAAPYMSHLLAVTGNALEHGATEDEAIAALLHDAVEDQGGAATLAEIERRFGAHVATIVAECTDSHESPRPPWRQRKAQFLARLRLASHSARVVTLADKLHNARSLLIEYRILGDALWGQFTGGRAGILWYYGSLIAIFREYGPNPFVEELARTILELERLSERDGR